MRLTANLIFMSNMGDLFAKVKQVTDIVQKYNDVPLMKEINSLVIDASELTQQNWKLQEELREAKELLKQSGEMKLHSHRGYYERKGDPFPICPHCWDSDRKILRLQKIDQSHHVWRCHKCKWQDPSEEALVIKANAENRTGGSY